MKGEYEAATRFELPKQTYTVMRLDGRAFHSYTKSCARPYDLQFMSDMDQVATVLCSEVTGCALGYVQSDEISLVVTDFATERTQPWFGGVLQKMVSVAASLASAELNRLRYDAVGKLALFDCRAFTIDDRSEVVEYLTWRQKDCERNSVSMMAQTHFSAKQLHGKSTAACRQHLTDLGDSWDAAPAGFRHGRLVTRRVAEEDVSYVHKRTGETLTANVMRSRWVAEPAPPLSAAGILDDHLPFRPER